MDEFGISSGHSMSVLLIGYISYTANVMHLTNVKVRRSTMLVAEEQKVGDTKTQG
jgi:hypothetical protein